MRFFWPQFQEKVSVLSKRKARKIELIDEIKRNDAYNTITLIRRRCSRLLISCLATFFFLQYAYYGFLSHKLWRIEPLSLLSSTSAVGWYHFTAMGIHYFAISHKYLCILYLMQIYKGCKMSVYISHSMTKFVMRSNKKRYKKQCPLLFLEI